MHNRSQTPQLLTEGIQDFGIFKAVFMAGSPGSGKSTVRRKLFGGLGLKVVDADEIRAAYIRLGKQGDYEVYGELVRRQRMGYMDQRLGIIMDTTAWWLPSIQETTHQLTSLGYDVGMVHVFTPLHMALQRVAQRAQQEGRDVPTQEVIKRFEGLKYNARDFIDMFGDHYWFVDNSGTSPHLDLVQRDIQTWLRSPPHNVIAQQWLRDQTLKRGQSTSPK